jgi:hypothetical protein
VRFENRIKKSHYNVGVAPSCKFRSRRFGSWQQDEKKNPIFNWTTFELQRHVARFCACDDFSLQIFSKFFSKN